VAVTPIIFFLIPTRNRNRSPVLRRR